MKIVLPLTIISFATITKWWYALPEDAPDTIFTGFPFPFVCQGWHTSLSLQIFVAELAANFLTYFLFWLVVVNGIDRFVIKLKVQKAIAIALWVFSGLILVYGTLLAANRDNLFYAKRPFSMEVMETGFRFTWQHPERPEFFKYHPEAKKQ